MNRSQMKNSQWNLISAAISTAITLCNSRIHETESKPKDWPTGSGMYREWLSEAKRAHEELISIIPVDDPAEVAPAEAATCPLT